MSKPAIYHTGSEPLIVCNQEQTAALLGFEAMLEAIAGTVLEHEKGEINSPERMVVPLGDGGVLLSMPATAKDIAIHKLVNVQPGNKKNQLPTIHGTVTVCDAQTGKIICLLDGPEVTGRRTAAVSMLGIRTFLPAKPSRILLIGTGVQARYHLQAINALFPAADVLVRGSSLTAAQQFCQQNAGSHSRLAVCGETLPADLDVVLTLTTSTKAVYDLPAIPERLIIGVGAFKPEMCEIGKNTLDSSVLYVDDADGARHEAGDFIQAGVDWSAVNSLAHALHSPDPLSRPVVFKTVGTAAWDLAVARVALQSLTR